MKFFCWALKITITYPDETATLDDITLTSSITVKVRPKISSFQTGLWNSGWPNIKILQLIQNNKNWNKLLYQTIFLLYFSCFIFSALAACIHVQTPYYASRSGRMQAYLQSQESPKVDWETELLSCGTSFHSKSGGGGLDIIYV